MVEVEWMWLVDFDTGVVLAEGYMTFGEADAIVSRWFAGHNVQVLTADDISPSW